jgi:hypothetical protein
MSHGVSLCLLTSHNVSYCLNQSKELRGKTFSFVTQSKGKVPVVQCSSSTTTRTSYSSTRTRVLSSTHKQYSNYSTYSSYCSSTTVARRRVFVWLQITVLITGQEYNTADNESHWTRLPLMTKLQTMNDCTGQAERQRRWASPHWCPRFRKLPALIHHRGYAAPFGHHHQRNDLQVRKKLLLRFLGAVIPNSLWTPTLFEAHPVPHVLLSPGKLAHTAHKEPQDPPAATWNKRTSPWVLREREQTNHL